MPANLLAGAERVLALLRGLLGHPASRPPAAGPAPSTAARPAAPGLSPRASVSGFFKSVAWDGKVALAPAMPAGAATRTGMPALAPPPGAGAVLDRAAARRLSVTAFFASMGWDGQRREAPAPAPAAAQPPAAKAPAPEPAFARAATSQPSAESMFGDVNWD